MWSRTRSGERNSRWRWRWVGHTSSVTGRCGYTSVLWSCGLDSKKHNSGGELVWRSLTFIEEFEEWIWEIRFKLARTREVWGKSLRKIQACATDKCMALSGRRGMIEEPLKIRVTMFKIACKLKTAREHVEGRGVNRNWKWEDFDELTWSKPQENVSWCRQEKQATKWNVDVTVVNEINHVPFRCLLHRRMNAWKILLQLESNPVLPLRGTAHSALIF